MIIILGCEDTYFTHINAHFIAFRCHSNIMHSTEAAINASQVPVTSASSQFYDEWSNSSVPLYMQYYFWNLLNPCMLRAHVNLNLHHHSLPQTRSAISGRCRM